MRKSFAERVQQLRPHYYCAAAYGTMPSKDEFQIINGSTGQGVTQYFKTPAAAWKSALWKIETELP